jgi:hypothetical protein
MFADLAGGHADRAVVREYIRSLVLVVDDSPCVSTIPARSDDL